MPRQSQAEATPMMRAAATAKVGYGVVLLAVLKGTELTGWQDEETRRWYVNVASLDRWIAKRAARGPGSAPQSAAARAE